MHLKASGNRGVWSLVAARPAGFAFQSGKARVVLTPPATIHPGLSTVGSQCLIHVQTGEARLCAGGRESWTIGLYNSHSRPASLAPLKDSEQEGLLRKAMAMPRALWVTGWQPTEWDHELWLPAFHTGMVFTADRQQALQGQRPINDTCSKGWATTHTVSSSCLLGEEWRAGAEKTLAF